MLMSSNLFFKSESSVERKQQQQQQQQQIITTRSGLWEHVTELHCTQAHGDMLRNFIVPNILLHEQLHYGSNYGYSVILLATDCLWRHWDAILLFYLADFFFIILIKVRHRVFWNIILQLTKNLIHIDCKKQIIYLGREGKKEGSCFLFLRFVLF